MTNEKYTAGSITVKKVDENGNPLKGAEFTLACNFGWRMPKETAEDGEKAQSGVILMPEVQDG